MAQRYASPFTGDTWIDVRPAIGTIAGLANFLNAKRPRRKPPEGHDAAIALATDAAGAFAGIPKVVRVGEVEGRRISDAYWQAKEAKAKLMPLVDQHFLRMQEWRGEVWQRDRLPTYPEDHNLPATAHAVRLAWYAANLTEKAAANSHEVELGGPSFSYSHHVVLGARLELDLAGVDTKTAAGVERIWRFVVAAGRMPEHPADDDLLAAFEAALMADQPEFAANLAKCGYGSVGDGS